jgi:O-antigen/teichoic acid export membrane protein
MNNKLSTKIASLLKKGSNTGFLHIIISSTLVKIVSFISSIFLPRFLSKDDFGLLAYVDNIMGYILLINGLGIVNATIRFVPNEKSDEDKMGIFITTIIIGLIFDIILLGILVIGLFTLPINLGESKELLSLMILIPPLTFIFEDIQLFLRALFKNKSYSILSFIYTIMMVVLQITFALMFYLNGVIIARYIALILSISTGSFIIYKIINVKKLVKPNNRIIKELLKYSIIVMIGNSLSMVIQLNELTIISYFVGDQQKIADYKVSTYIFSITYFLTQSILLFAYPYFVKNKENKEWLDSNYNKLFKYNMLAMIPIHLLLLLFSKLFITILFGSEYLTALTTLRVLIIASFIQTSFRSVPGNILTGIGYEKYNFYVNIIVTLLHFILNIVIIYLYGYEGAGYALIISYMFSGILLHLKVKRVIKKVEINHE